LVGVVILHEEVHVHIGVVVELKIALHAEGARVLIELMAHPALPLWSWHFLNKASRGAITVFAGMEASLLGTSFGHFEFD
jgi:hypothetical protein